MGTQHRFWLSAAQIAYHVYDSGGGTWDPQLNKVLPGPYCLGEAPGRVPGGLVPNDPLDPPANPPLPDADNVWRLISVPPPQGVGAFQSDPGPTVASVAMMWPRTRPRPAVAAPRRFNCRLPSRLMRQRAPTSGRSLSNTLTRWNKQ